jgi:transposase
VPNCDDELKPKIGQVFDTLEEVKIFLRKIRTHCHELKKYGHTDHIFS